MLKFRTEGVIEVNGLRNAVVKNPHGCKDFTHIIGKDVEVDGIKERVIGVERFAHCPPWREGEMIGLKLAT